MSVEPRRGCGFRKAGGTYLESDPGGFECGRLPIPLLPCPLCDQRPRFTRGLQKVSPKNLLHSAPPCQWGGHSILPKLFSRPVCSVCPYGRIESQEVAALQWVGVRHYSPEEFSREAVALGVSRRVPWPLPKWFEVGKMWVFLAHEEARVEPCPGPCGGRGFVRTGEEQLPERCEICEGEAVVKTPAIFFAFKPQRVVRIVSKSMPTNERLDLMDKGLVLVEVPDDDPDHAPRKGAEEE